MLVTFISQCEKKALSRTRRVLDAFADRIGDRTWQTIITEDGLLMVKKLLRQTATKNTAVACHWRRSRNRSDLLWIVGNQEQFNNSGIVPVNITQKHLIMDEPTMKNVEKYYANTHLQPLVEHLFAVGYVAEQIVKQLLPNSTEMTKAAFVAGCFHDLGKVDPKFQEWVINPKRCNFIDEDGQHIDDKFNFDKHPRHNELSLLFYHLLDKNELKTINESNKNSIKHVIYWHHAKPFRKEKDYKKLIEIYAVFNNNLKDKDWKHVVQTALKRLKEVCKIEVKYRSNTESILAKCFSDEISSVDCLHQISLPDYKIYSNHIENIDSYVANVQNNAINNILRSVIITADRLISELSAEALQQSIQYQTFDNLVAERLLKESSLYVHINECLNNFNMRFPNSERNIKQNEVAKHLLNVKDIGVLSGAAGCGKTKIALEWAKLKNAKQIFWICPRVYVCQGLFNELISEKYLPNARIEINTGEFKYTNAWDNHTVEKEYFSGDVVITTIDQILNNIITHTKVTGLVDFINVHVVFDEFHEYINMPAFNLLFAELVQCKRQREGQANTLLVSATPNYYFVNKVLGITSLDIIKMPSFNQSEYQIEFKICNESLFDDSNLLYKAQSDSTFVISNTALTAQKSFICNQSNENAILLHSKYKKSDKRKWFNEVYESFKENGTRKFGILRSGPIVQASLNISCNYMIAELTHAEDTLQRLGRLDRFGKNSGINQYHIVVSEGIHKGRGDSLSARFLSRMNVFNAAQAWYQFLLDKLNGKSLKLFEIYALYEQFYQSEKSIELIASDILSAFKKSVTVINAKVIDPITIPSKKIKNKLGNKISKNSLRGDNRFVQLAVCSVLNLENPPQFEAQYAYEFNENGNIDNMTASIEEITGHGDSTKNLLSHMMKKHHNIIDGTKKAFKDFILLNEARNPETPIYLSYIPNHLDKVGGESARHSDAIYYVVTEKQPVGAMSIKQLTNNEE